MEQEESQRSNVSSSWPMMLNRFFIGIGVLALVFFLGGKVFQAFNNDDDKLAGSEVGVKQAIILGANELGTSNEARKLADLENLFGSQVVFVSASEPAYVITEDERRFEVGSISGTDVEISSITSTQLVLKQTEELIVFKLPVEAVN